MDNSNMWPSNTNNSARHNEHLGVNKMGKNIRKSPLHQPNFSNSNSNNTTATSASTATSTANTARQQPQPQVYNINKNDFRNVVQRLTGSPSHDSLPRPPNNSPKPPSMRLQKIRPPPLAPLNRPRQMYPPPTIAPAPMPPPVPVPGPVPPQGHYNNSSYPRPGLYGGQPSPAPLTPGNSLWASAADSPISAYMRYLQHSMMDSGPRYPPQQPQLLHQGPGPAQYQHQPPPPSPSSGLLPNPPMPMPPLLPSPRMNYPSSFPSPTSQFLLPSPNFFNLSPRSPYPLLSPGIQYPQPLTPNFPFTSVAQSGILGPGPQAPPLSPGIVFPLSPSGFFSMSSPRWRGQ